MSESGAGQAKVATETPAASMPSLTLANAQHGIKFPATDGAIIGRKGGPYKQFFEKNMYVSGLHAQLVYSRNDGWGVVDKNSSNGTFVNGNRILPDQFVALKNGDVLKIAVLDLHVNII